jgi:hypothetical protein
MKMARFRATQGQRPVESIEIAATAYEVDINGRGVLSLVCKTTEMEPAVTKARR